MKCGKLTQSVYERSVIKVMKANGAGLGADCAVLAGNGDCAGILSGQAAWMPALRRGHIWQRRTM